MNIDKTLIFGVLSASLLAACTSLTPELDSSFGNAVNQAKAQQTLNPDASLDTAPVSSSGDEGALAVEGYHESLKSTPEPPPTVNINIGGGN